MSNGRVSWMTTETKLQTSCEWHAVGWATTKRWVQATRARGKCMLAVAVGKKGARAITHTQKETSVTEPSVVVMRHRCSPWIHIPCQRQGCEGWKVVKESIELQDRPQCSSRLSWQIIICSVLTPQEFMNNHPKMAHPPEACCYSGRPSFF